MSVQDTQLALKVVLTQTEHISAHVQRISGLKWIKGAALLTGMTQY